MQILISSGQVRRERLTSLTDQSHLTIQFPPPCTVCGTNCLHKLFASIRRRGIIYDSQGSVSHSISQAYALWCGIAPRGVLGVCYVMCVVRAIY